MPGFDYRQSLQNSIYRSSWDFDLGNDSTDRAFPFIKLIQSQDYFFFLTVAAQRFSDAHQEASSTTDSNDSGGTETSSPLIVFCITKLSGNSGRLCGPGPEFPWSVEFEQISCKVVVAPISETAGHPV